MPTFATPEPIVARIYANGGTIRMVAAERVDTVVEIRPHDPNRSADVRSADEARITYTDGRLAVEPAKFGFLGARMGAVDISVELPTGSEVHVAVASAEVHAVGEYANVKFDAASGDLDIDTISGSASISTASGNATVRTVNGDLKFRAASGSLDVRRQRGNVSSHTASGSVTIAGAHSGAITAHTASGEVEIGIPEGTAARLDITSGSGTVTNRLPHADGPGEGDDTLTVAVRTGSGDVEVRRSSPSAAQAAQ